MGVKVSRVVSRIRAFDQSGGVLGRLWADEHALALALHPTSATASIATATTTTPVTSSGTCSGTSSGSNRGSTTSCATTRGARSLKTIIIIIIIIIIISTSRLQAEKAISTVDAMILLCTRVEFEGTTAAPLALGNDMRVALVI